MSPIHLLLIVGLSAQPDLASPVVSTAPSILDLGKFPSRSDCMTAAREAASNVVTPKHEIDLNSADKAVEKAQRELADATKDADANPSDAKKKKAREAAMNALKQAQQNADDIKNYVKKNAPPGGISFLCVERND